MADRQLSLDLEPALPGLPATLRPMLPRLASEPFDSADHLFEPSWAGERALAFVEAANVRPAGGSGYRLIDQHGRDVAPLLPELADLPLRLAARSAIVDGELVVVDEGGRSNPHALEQRLGGLGGPFVAYLVFDLLYVDGRPLLGEPLARRRQLLRRTVQPGEALVSVPSIAGEGRALYEAVLAQGIGGVMARHRQSPYLPGVRSRLWRFIAAAGGAAPTEAGAAPTEAGAAPTEAGAAPTEAGAAPTAAAATVLTAAASSSPAAADDNDARSPSAGPLIALIRRLPLDEDP